MRQLMADPKHTKSYATYAKAEAKGVEVAQRAEAQYPAQAFVTVVIGGMPDGRFHPVFHLNSKFQHMALWFAQQGHMVLC